MQPCGWNNELKNGRETCKLSENHYSLNSEPSTEVNVVTHDFISLKIEPTSPLSFEIDGSADYFLGKLA